MKARNALLIMSGFVIGQGGMFLVQSLLAVEGEFELIAQIGIGLGLLSLAQWTADFGGVYVLSRKYVEKESILEYLLVRCVCVLVLALICYALVFMFPERSVMYDIAVWAPLVVLVWGGNITGLLDANKLNQIVGPLSGIPWLISALVVLFYYKGEVEEDVGNVIGGGYFLGECVLVLVQYIQGKNLYFSGALKGRSVGNAKVLSEILGFFSAYAFSQIYGRLVPIFISGMIGGAEAGYYVYAKSISNISAQFVSFTRRVEFSSLVGVELSVVGLIVRQRYSLLIVVLSMVVFSSIYILLGFNWIALDHKFKEALPVVLFLQVVQVFWIFPSLLGQYFVANNKIWIYGGVQSFTAVVSISVMYFLIPFCGIYSVYISEVVMFAFQMYLYMRYYRSAS